MLLRCSITQAYGSAQSKVSLSKMYSESLKGSDHVGDLRVQEVTSEWTLTKFSFIRNLYRSAF